MGPPVPASTKIFFALLKSEGLPLPEMEFRFHAGRRWRFDYAWPGHKLALEVEGGLWVAGGGRHNHGPTMLKDMFKYNAAAALGWRVLKSVPDGKRGDADKPYLCSGYTVNLLKEILLENGEALGSKV